MKKIDIYHNIKSEVKDTKKAYENALDKFTTLVEHINQNLVNGTPQNNNAFKNLIKPYTQRLNETCFKYLLAEKKLKDFISGGVINE